MADDEPPPRPASRPRSAERERLTAEVTEQLAGDAETLATFQAAMASAAVWLAARERCKTNMIRLIGEIRTYFLELGRRMVERGALDDARADLHAPGGRARRASASTRRRSPRPLRERELDYLALFDLEPPFIVDTTAPPLSAWRQRADRRLTPVEPGTVLVGTAGSGGVATGRARVIHDPSDPGALEPGDILVRRQHRPGVDAAVRARPAAWWPASARWAATR